MKHDHHESSAKHYEKTAKHRHADHQHHQSGNREKGVGHAKASHGYAIKGDTSAAEAAKKYAPMQKEEDKKDMENGRENERE